MIESQTGSTQRVPSIKPLQTEADYDAALARVHALMDIIATQDGQTPEWQEMQVVRLILGIRKQTLADRGRRIHLKFRAL